MGDEYTVREANQHRSRPADPRGTKRRREKPTSTVRARLIRGVLRGGGKCHDVRRRISRWCPPPQWVASAAAAVGGARRRSSGRRR